MITIEERVFFHVLAEEYDAALALLGRLSRRELRAFKGACDEAISLTNEAIENSIHISSQKQGRADND